MAVAIGLGLYADFGSLGDELASFRWELFPLALAFTTLNYALRFWRWQRYLSRVRIEKSKNLLLNPNLRVSEIAFEVGFQSLTHFNRVFKKVLGQTPTDYRAQLLGG